MPTMKRYTTQRKATTHLSSLDKWRHTINYTRTQRNKRLQWPEQQKFASQVTYLRLAIFRFMCDKQAEILQLVDRLPATLSHEQRGNGVLTMSGLKACLLLSSMGRVRWPLSPVIQSSTLLRGEDPQILSMLEESPTHCACSFWPQQPPFGHVLSSTKQISVFVLIVQAVNSMEVPFELNGQCNHPESFCFTFTLAKTAKIDKIAHCFPSCLNNV